MKDIITINGIHDGLAKNKEAYISACEEHFKNQVLQVVDFCEQNKNIVFVLLAGPSSSGKTTTSKILKSEFEKRSKNVLTLSLDDFFVERAQTPNWEDGTPNYETFEAIDWKLFFDCVKELFCGKEVNLPTYDFSKGIKEFGKATALKKNSIVIVEGLHALNPLFDKYLPKEVCCKVYISLNSDLYNGKEVFLEHNTMRLYRRLIRDLYTRSTTIDQTLSMWEKVEVGRSLYIAPFKDQAKFAIDSFHPYELCVYKTVLQNLNLPNDDSVQEILQTLEPFEALPTSIVPKDSVLQEFVPQQKN